MQLDLLVDGGWQHLDLAARGRGSIGKAIYGADQSVRRLLVGGKARNGAFSVAPSRGAPRTPRRRRARASGSRKSSACARRSSKALVTRHEPTCISVARCARIIIWSLALSLPTPLAFLTPLCWVPLKTPHFASSHPPAAGARSDQPRISPYRWVSCPGSPDPGAASLHRPAGPAAQHYVQNEQTGGTEAGQRWIDRASGRRSAEKH